MCPQSQTADDGTGGKGPSVIENTLAILRCFSPDRQELGVTEIAARVGLHKSTVSRVLSGLESEGLVEQTQSKRYRLGLGIIALAGPLLADLDVRKAGMPILADLTEETGETSAVIMWTGLEAITVEQIPSPQQVKHTSSLGSRYHTARSASVQVFLAEEDDAAVRDLLAGGRIRAPHDPDGTAAYLEQLRRVRADGVAVNNAQTSADEVGIAAPIRDHRGAVVAAVLIAAPKFRVDDEAINGLQAACSRAAARVTRRLGGE